MKMNHISVLMIVYRLKGESIPFFDCYSRYTSPHIVSWMSDLIELDLEDCPFEETLTYHVYITQFKYDPKYTECKVIEPILIQHPVEKEDLSHFIKVRSHPNVCHIKLQEVLRKYDESTQILGVSHLRYEDLLVDDVEDIRTSTALKDIPVLESLRSCEVERLIKSNTEEIKYTINFGLEYDPRDGNLKFMSELRLYATRSCNFIEGMVVQTEFSENKKLIITGALTHQESLRLDVLGDGECVRKSLDKIISMKYHQENTWCHQVVFKGFLGHIFHEFYDKFGFRHILHNLGVHHSIRSLRFKKKQMNPLSKNEVLRKYSFLGCQITNYSIIKNGVIIYIM